MFERFTRTARVAVVVAQEEARMADSSHIEVEHVLLGVLHKPDPALGKLLADVGLTVEDARSRLPGIVEGPLGKEDAEALKSIGIDLDAVRASLEANFGADALDRELPDSRRGFFGGRMGHIPFTSSAKKTLELALREAIRRQDKSIGAEHILLAILRAPSPTARAMVEAHLPIADLRERVLALLDRAA